MGQVGGWNGGKSAAYPLDLMPERDIGCETQHLAINNKIELAIRIGQHPRQHSALIPKAQPA